MSEYTQLATAEEEIARLLREIEQLEEHEEELSSAAEPEPREGAPAEYANGASAVGRAEGAPSAVGRGDLQQPRLELIEGATDSSDDQQVGEPMDVNGPAAVSSSGELPWYEEKDLPNDDADEGAHDAPEWFEHELFRWITECKLVYRPVYFLLGLAPFLTSAGSFAELFYGCPTISPGVEGLFAAGTALFSFTWIFYFYGLQKVVSGTHLVRKRLDVDDEKIQMFLDAVQHKVQLVQLTPRQQVNVELEVLARTRKQEAEQKDAVYKRPRTRTLTEQAAANVEKDKSEANKQGILSDQVVTQFGLAYYTRTNEYEKKWRRQAGYEQGHRAVQILRAQMFTFEAIEHIAKILVTEGKEFNLETVQELTREDLVTMLEGEADGWQQAVIDDTQWQACGAIAKLSSGGGLGVKRVTLTKKCDDHLHVRRNCYATISVLFLGVAVVMFVGLVELLRDDFNRSDLSPQANVVDVLFFPRDGCISHTVIRGYAYVLLVLWIPAVVIFSLAFPTWQLSLALGVELVKDDVEDLMKDLGPLAVQDYMGADGTQGEKLWVARVAGPGAMLVSQLGELSEWGTAMGASMIGFWAFALCLVPTSVATKNTVMNIGLAVCALFPLLTALGPANVSSSCDDMLNQLNDLSFLGNRHHKDRCTHLRHSLMNLNTGQGLGFLVFGTHVPHPPALCDCYR
jgi:hypothetical protein